MRLVLMIIAISYGLNGLWMIVDPKLWYDTIPGITMLGPYNTHFLRDVGIVYGVCAGGFIWGLRAGASPALIVAAGWPVLHAIYHLQMWMARGFALDVIALVNFGLIQAPAWIGLWISWRLFQTEKDGPKLL